MSLVFCLLGTFNVVFASLFLHISTVYRSVKKIFRYIPISLVEDSIRLLGENEEIEYHFDKEQIEENIKEYLTLSMRDKINSYDIGFTYFLIEDGDPQIYFGDYPKGVVIDFKTKLVGEIELKMRKSYYIEGTIYEIL